MSSNDVLLQVEGLTKKYPIQKGLIFQKVVGYVHAVDDISFNLYRGETLGLVGESGCGKSTTGRIILHIEKPTSGNIFFEGRELTAIGENELRKTRKRMQMIFQDCYASLNPKMTAGEIIAEPLIIHNVMRKKELNSRVEELMMLVGLEPSFSKRYPHQFSGGQRQRIGIARALALEPSLIVCDEPISALDVSIQAQVINLLEDLQSSLDLTYLIVAHDLSMIRHISDRVAVMYLGIIAELADRNELYNNPLHPYTQALLSAVPIPDPEQERHRQRIILKGDVPSPINPPSGCRFRTRCPLADDICAAKKPVYREIKSDHWVACHMV